MTSVPKTSVSHTDLSPSMSLSLSIMQSVAQDPIPLPAEMNDLGDDELSSVLLESSPLIKQQEESEEEEKERAPFEDGYQFGDLTRATWRYFAGSSSSSSSSPKEEASPSPPPPSVDASLTLEDWEYVDGEQIKRDFYLTDRAFQFEYVSNHRNPIPEDLVCPLCTHPLASPVIWHTTDISMKYVCLSCLCAEMREEASTLVKQSNIEIPPDGDEIVERCEGLLCRCPFSKYGCGEVKTRGELGKHMHECPHFRYLCANSIAGCKKGFVTFEKMEQHIKECDFSVDKLNQYRCETCVESFSLPKENWRSAIKKREEEPCRYHSGTWHGFTYQQVRRGGAGVASYRVTDGVKVGLLIPTLSVMAGGLGLVGAGGVVAIGVVTGAVVVGIAGTLASIAVISVPLVFAGSLIISPVETTSLIARTAYRTAHMIATGVGTVIRTTAEAGIETASYLIHNPLAPFRAVVTSTRFLLFTAPAYTIWAVVGAPRMIVNVVANESLMEMAPFEGLSPWSCCGRLGSFAEPCCRKDGHRFKKQAPERVQEPSFLRDDFHKPHLRVADS